MWPPSNPDLNVMDFSVWSILESRACKVAHDNKEQLVLSLEKAWDEISPEEVKRCCAKVRVRLEKCVAAEGGHFERC